MTTSRPGTRGRALPRSFYDRDALELAPELLNKLLVRTGDGPRLAARIVEVEAYRGADDPGSHAFRRQTPRNATMFGPPGHLYVYFTYGMHYCMNVVTGREGKASAVLIRALEPVAGIERMAARRGEARVDRIARGPACLTRALGIGREHDGVDLVAGPVWIADLPARRGGLRIARGPRIGIRHAVEQPWRFWLEGHPAVSGGRKSSLGAATSR